MRSDRKSTKDADLGPDVWRTPQYDTMLSALNGLSDDDRVIFLLDKAKSVDQTLGATIRERGVEMKGCQARVWVEMSEHDGELAYRGASEAALVQGLVVVMAQSFSGLSRNAILAAPLDSVRAFPLGAMTTHRQVGMMAMLKHMQKLARGSVA